MLLFSSGQPDYGSLVAMILTTSTELAVSHIKDDLHTSLDEANSFLSWYTFGQRLYISLKTMAMSETPSDWVSDAFLLVGFLGMPHLVKDLLPGTVIQIELDKEGVLGRPRVQVLSNGGFQGAVI